MSSLAVTNPLIVEGTAFRCFPVPAGAVWSQGILFREKVPEFVDVGEIVESFSSETAAIAAFNQFTTGTDECSYTSSSNKVVIRYTWVPVSGLASVDSESHVWNALLQEGSSKAFHGGSQFAVRDGLVDAFGWDNVDAHLQPNLKEVENRMIVVLGSQLLTG